MAKKEVTRCRKRQSKGVAKQVVEEEESVINEEQQETDPSSKEVVRKEGVEMKADEEKQDEDSQMDTVIEVRGSKSTINVSWDKKKGGEDLEKTSGQKMDSELQMETEAGEPESSPTVTVIWENKNEPEKDDVAEQIMETTVNAKRKAESTDDTSPSKKSKLINEGFCFYVGNLNTSKSFDEVNDALASYFMTQSLLIQDIRLNLSRKHAHVDVASQMDLTKALTLDGEMLLDKPMKIEEAKTKRVEKVKVKVKVKASAEEKKAPRDAKCLFLKNVPYKATKEDILKVFHKAVSVRFPDGAEGPTKGIAFVEFENETTAKQVREENQAAKIQDRLLIVDFVGKRPEVTKTKDNADDDNNNNNNNTKPAASPNNILFVSNLPHKVKEQALKKLFQKAVTISIPQSKGKTKGFAFVEFATLADAEQALKSSQKITISKRKIRVQFEVHGKLNKEEVVSKTLIVMGLAEKTSAETLKSAFEGSISSRIILDKETRVSKGYGFVDFESEENSKAVKESMEDCEIDGSKVTVAYAKSKPESGSSAARSLPEVEDVELAKPQDAVGEVEKEAEDDE